MGCASLPLGEDREAGASPALPRNCKRGSRRRSLGIPGKAGCKLDELGSHPYSRSQETGAFCPPQPLSREKEDGMRVARALVTVLVVISAASAAELKIKVIDPQGAAVAGAQVSLQKGVVSHRLANSIGDGTASFADLRDGEYEVEVLAPGFARFSESVAVPGSEPVIVQLQL